MSSRPVAPVRSLLFVPGNRPTWVAKAESAGADGVILDLEDAVPADLKTRARAAVADLLRESRPKATVIVRINALAGSAALDDLEAVVVPGLDGVMVPKVETVADMQVVDRLLGWLEQRAGIEPGTVRIVPVLETAAGIRSAYDLATASSRTAYLGGIATRGGDVERSIGYRWSSSGDETSALRGTTLIDVRAAGVPNPITGMWSDVDDLDGLRRFAVASRALGYEGMLAIHPSHVPIINEVFTPTEAELADDAALLEAVAKGASDGRGAIVHDGRMVDEAMAETARQRLTRYRP